MSFILKTIETSVVDHQAVIFRPSDDDIKEALHTSFLKSQFTMSSSQASQHRDEWVKLNRQFEGVLGELSVIKLLKKKLNDDRLKGWVISRYDDVRLDGYKSPEGEYDIRISNDKNNIDFEIRSSILYRQPNVDEKIMTNYDIIGPYVSQHKKNECSTDFYVRPLYVIDKSITGISKSELDRNFIFLFIQGKISLYLVAGCTREMMFSEVAIEKAMSQGSTKYRCLPMIKGFDIPHLIESIVERILNTRCNY